MNYLKISLGIFLVLACSRFIPHPPNFTSLIALSFYVPAILGFKFLPIVALSFALTDLFFSFHSITLFTWGSVILIGLISKFMRSKIFLRLLGAFFGAWIFFIITNFGVWLFFGNYEHSVNGLILCYTLALPFFNSTIISTLLFSAIFEMIFFSKSLYQIYLKKLIS